jgi:hypothetical protein
MNQIASRRFLVRDDGTGRSKDTEVAISDFEHESAIVILGDPGIGKTTLLWGLASDGYVKVRRFLADPKNSTTTLFLDALDEYRNSASNRDAILDISRTLIGLGRPRFRLSCRAADWFGSVDQDVLAAASSSGHLVILELLPLNDDEVAHVVTGLVPDPTSFLSEARSAGLGPLLGNPQTLELIARAWSGPRKPRNKFDAYELGINELLKETNSAHVVRGTQSDFLRLRRGAAAMASSLLLSNKDSVSRLESMKGDAGVVFSDVPYEEKSDLDAALRRRVFTSANEDSFEFVHRTIQEFLAAEDLASRVENGLPIDRALALMCWRDGAPVSSLRGLYAWFTCKLGTRATAYVDRDPYAVVKYGDVSELPPESQRALWTSLRSVADPWFLSGEDRGSSFRNLANRNTADVLAEILSDKKASAHLKIAVLEAIAAAEEDLGLTATVRQVVLKQEDNAWLRSTAIRALANLVRGDFEVLREVDNELAADPRDGAGSEVRLELIQLTLKEPDLAERTLSVLEQFSSSETRRALGRLYLLGKELPESAIDSVLRGGERILKGPGRHPYEIEAFFEELLTRRLYSSQPLNPDDFAKALTLVHRRGDPERSLFKTLQTRLQREPELLSALFDALSANHDDDSFWIFVAHHLWQILPPSIWPVLPSSFFLERAKEASNAERAADLFRIYVGWFPRTNASAALAQEGFDFIRSRKDVRRTLGKWNVSKPEEWRVEENRRRSKDTLKRSAAKSKTIEYLTPRLSELSSGADQRALLWGAGIYLGLYIDVDGETPHDRFVDAASPEIEAACIQGFIQFAERDDIPEVQEVIACWNNNQIPWRHSLLTLSLYLRTIYGLTVPAKATPACVTAVVTGLSGDKVPGFQETVNRWFVQQAQLAPSIVSPILQELWIAKRGLLSGFHELRGETTLTSFLADVSATVLRSPLCDDYTVRTLVPVLFAGDSRTAEAIGRTKLCDPCLDGVHRAIWITALYLSNPKEYAATWKQLDTESNDIFWEAIELIAARQPEGSRRMTPSERADLIANVCRRFPPADFPTSGWAGTRNAWDASSFVARQIDELAADPSEEASVHLDALERDPSVLGYRDHIRHRRVQQARQRRELDFIVPSPLDVRQALMNRSPATPGDLLAYIEDHLKVLSFELTRTQRERYRAYWNETNRNLVSPKREEACSGLLAEDLQNRVRQHGLVVTVEHHMVDDKECDLVVLQGANRLLPIEAKHHYHRELWTAWNTQLQRLYTRDAGAGGLGVYLVFWSGISSGRAVPKPNGRMAKPTSPDALQEALQSLIPPADRQRLRVVVIDIASPTDVRPKQEQRKRSSGSKRKRARSGNPPARKKRSHGPRVQKGRKKAGSAKNRAKRTRSLGSKRRPKRKQSISKA